MLKISEFTDFYNQFKQNPSIKMIETLKDYMVTRFSETTSIFSKMNAYDTQLFLNKTEYRIFQDKDIIFNKGDKCQHYLFNLYGDINLFEIVIENDITNLKEGKRLIKTIPGGTLYGHKIKSNFNSYLITNKSSHVILINKQDFDEMIEVINKKKAEAKINFLKKFVPKFRNYTDDLIDTLKDKFIRTKYEKNSKILIDREFDENIYFIINGNCQIIKNLKYIDNTLSLDYMRSNEDNVIKIDYNERWPKYLILEKLKKGDIFGAYSALKHHKNNFSVIVTSESCEVYSISKSNCLYFFGGAFGMIPDALKGIDNMQQLSILNKIKFFKENLKNSFKMFEFIYNEENSNDSKNQKKENDITVLNGEKTNSNKNINLDFNTSDTANTTDTIKTINSTEIIEQKNKSQNALQIKSSNTFKKGKNEIIDETPIENSIKLAWEEVEKMSSHLNEIKASLLGTNKNAGTAPKKTFNFDELNKMNKTNDKTSVMGFATDRVTGRKLGGLTSTQLNGFNKLQLFGAVKKKVEDNNEKTDIKDKDIEFLNKINILKKKEDILQSKKKIFGNIE